MENHSALASHKKTLLYIGILALFFIVIFFVNFPFNTWYTGWDNLHPEFNFGLNFKRALQAVWQPNQGLGTFGGHGYAATLPHTIVTFLMSLIIPLQYIRSSFTFLMLFTGSIGMFFLTKKLLKNSVHESLSDKAALASALFYMLNLSTIQNFYIQLEAFIIHFAALPFLFLTVINLLHTKTKKNFFLFFVVSLIASAQGFIPPLFFVYMLMLALFLFAYVLFNFSFRNILTALLIGIATILINGYWLYPVLVYTSTNSSVYLNAYSNLASTEDFILKNKKYGNIQNVTLLKGFIFEAIDSLEGGKIITIFQQWQNHLGKPIVMGIGYGLFGFVAFGAGILFKKRNRWQYVGLFFGFLLIFSLLANDTFPFSSITSFIQRIPPLRQAFRVAFTKFSIALSFYYALFFGFGFVIIIERLLTLFKQEEKKLAEAFCMVLTIFLLCFFCAPLFTGNLLYKRTKIVIPSNYFQVFDFFKQQNPNEKIADFPQGWYWGWTVDKWGYSGSGYLWYGIEQPILHRSFDVWGKYNENYYWEMNYALYSEQYDKLDKIFSKYHVQWVLFDKNLIPYPNAKGFLYADNIEAYFDSSSKYKLVKTFHPNNNHIAKDIKIYRVLQDVSPSDRKIINKPYNIGPAYDYTDNDVAYYEYGDYITDPSTAYDVYYPFRSLMTKRQLGEIPVSISETPSQIVFSGKLPPSPQLYTLSIPSFDQKISSIEAILITSPHLEIHIGKNPETLKYDSAHDAGFLSRNVDNTPHSLTQISTQRIIDGALRFSSKNAENLYSLIFNSLEQRYGYVLAIENRHVQGKLLRLAVINNDAKKTDFEIALNKTGQWNTDYVIIPPMKKYGLGYAFQFNNISIGEEQTINQVRHIALYKIPYETIVGTKFLNMQTQKERSTQEKIIVYDQSFNTNWVTTENGKKLDKQLFVNNWQSGWQVNNENDPAHSFSFYFEPQKFEYIGFITVFIAIVIVIFFK